MAKNTPQQPSGRSKIRVLFIDADLAPGDMQQLTETLANAVRPTHILARVAPLAGRLNTGNNGHSADEFELEEIAAEDTGPDNDEESQVTTTPKGTAKPKKSRSPQVIDVDLDTDVSLVDFVSSHKPKNVAEKFLVVATWFKRHRDTDAIGIDHVYTCFLHPKLKWSTTMADFDAPFRQHKKRNRVTRKSAGLYSINHIGTGEVDEYADRTSE